MQNNIVSSRLLIRPLRLADSTAIAAYRGDLEHMRFQSWKPQSEIEVRDFIRGMQGLTPGLPGIWYQFALIRQADDCLVGDCGIHVPLQFVDAAELGLTLAPEHTGKGYATEALQAVIAFCFNTLHMRVIIARMALENYASLHLTERCGFQMDDPGEYGLERDPEERFATLKRKQWEMQGE
ncbi:GNAT family N-acetyltransferase [bacterium]|nr:GNAT family N-acetyltransferase [bacterium]